MKDIEKQAEFSIQGSLSHTTTSTNYDTLKFSRLYRLFKSRSSLSLQ